VCPAGSAFPQALGAGLGWLQSPIRREMPAQTGPALASASGNAWEHPVGGIPWGASLGEHPPGSIPWGVSHGGHPSGSIPWGASLGEHPAGSSGLPPPSRVPERVAENDTTLFLK